jgi:hypothetical protein
MDVFSPASPVGGSSVQDGLLGFVDLDGEEEPGKFPYWHFLNESLF